MSNESPEMRERLTNAVLVIRRQQARIAELESAGAQPIAVVGVGCRYPGGADSPDGFWRVLRDGVDAVREVPPDRWDVDAFYDDDRNAPGKMYTRHGTFLDGLDQFDPAFFGISPREAEQLDPQQRLLLEVTWETLEHAAIPPHTLRGSRTGVYVGSMSNDYAAATLVAGAAEGIVPYTGTGAAGSFLAGRLSYQFGWNGPSMPIDAACASSLVAVHLACAGLRNGECDLALAGGVNVILSPRMSVLISRLGALSADGRCKAFDASADGFGRGEGCGMVALKRLAEAQASGDRILAVVRGSAVNHNGSSSGLTVPNPMAQQAVIRAALESAGVAPETVDYVEAHGTGTILGDPAELRALWAVLGRDVPRTHPLVVGSVKTNIGHTEGAAGIAGLIKVVLALSQREIPPHLHLRQLNPHIVEEGVPIRIPVEPEPWPAGDHPRRAGVSSFGLSGINAHVVLEEAPSSAQVARPHAPAHGRRLQLSARTRPALRALARRYAVWIAEHPEADLQDVCHTALVGRTPFDEQLSVVADVREETVRLLDAFALDQPATGVEVRSVDVADDPPEPGVPAGRRIALPTYPFERRRYWHEEAAEVPAARFLREPVEVVAELRAEAAKGGATTSATAKGMTEVETIAVEYLMWGLARLGWRPKAGERVNPAVLAETLRVTSRYRRLLGRFLQILEKEGFVSREEEHWIVLRPPEATAPRRHRDQAVARFPRAAVELTLLDRCGTKLPDVLRGEVDPLGLIFPTDGAPGAVDLYHESAPLALLNRLCAEALGLAIRDVPIDRPLRVLEVGAGTGGTTQYLLPALAGRTVNFCYTDVSAAFFAAARERFSDHPDLEYRVLDLEVDPERQGFAPHAFDAVIAANVLHATRDLPQTLEHIRWMLASRGVLLLFEGITRRPSLDLTFGLLDGWWRFDDAVRADYPMLDDSQWNAVLRSAGFDAPGSVVPSEVQGSAAIILARGPRVTAPMGPATPDPTRRNERGKPAREAPAPSESAGFRERFAAAPPSDREALVTEFLQAEVCRLLGGATETVPEANQELFAYGFDSLMALELSERLRVALPMERPFEASVVFEKPTIAALARHLLELTDGDAAAPQPGGVGRDWSAESVLDDDIAAPAARVVPAGEPQAPLLTGATGFLGAFLLHELLEQTSGTVRCLVRCTDPGDGLNRLCQTLDAYGLLDERRRSRIIPTPGNLTQPRFGLSESEFDRLAASIDTIYHSGAAVNFLYGYEALRASNVAGTREVLRLASRHGGRRVHHVSTLYVLHIFEGLLLESAVPRDLDELGTFEGVPFAVGYAQSKAVAEQMVREAGRRGLPVTVYRPGFLAGSSRSGAWSVRDFPARLIKAWVELGVATPAQLNLTPADWVSRTIVELSRRTGSVGRTYHVATERSLSGQDIAAMFETIGVPLRLVAYEEWKAALAERVAAAGDTALLGLLEMMPARQPGVMDTAMQIDRRAVSAELKGSGPLTPVIDTESMRRYLRFFASRGFIGNRAGFAGNADDR